MISEPTVNPPRVESDYQIIDDHRRIVHLLEELVRERALLTALVDRESQAFSTAIIDIRENENILILDEFVPNPGNAMMTRGDRLWILGQLHGIKTAFHTDVRESGVENGVAYHRISMPAHVRHQQRRDSFRATVALGMGTRVRIRPEEGTPLTGQLRDLSIGGLSVILPLLKERGLLQPGTLVVDCEFDLPGQGRFAAKAEVRHLRHDEMQKNTRLGLAFRDLQPQDQRQLQRSVTHLEREQLRKKPKET